MMVTPSFDVGGVQPEIWPVALNRTRLDEATDAVERAFPARFGKGRIDGATKTLIVTGHKP